MHCQVFTCPLQTTPSAPNDLVPRKDSWGLTEGAPCISSDVCSRAAEGQCQTFVKFLFSLFLPSSDCHPCCKLLEWHKGKETGNKAYMQPSADIWGTCKEVKAILVKNFWATRFTMALKFTSLHFWHLKSSEKQLKKKKQFFSCNIYSKFPIPTSNNTVL